jgi:hypothetical protein
MVDIWLQADIGELRYDSYSIGDLVIKRIPPMKPYGPSEDCDFSRPFWALGLDECSLCNADIRMRVHVRDRRYVGVEPAQPGDQDFAWGY